MSHYDDFTHHILNLYLDFVFCFLFRSFWKYMNLSLAEVLLSPMKFSCYW